MKIIECFINIDFPKNHIHKHIIHSTVTHMRVIKYVFYILSLSICTCVFECIKLTVKSYLKVSACFSKCDMPWRSFSLYIFV